jgi:predicted nuclease with TOPRIM domain
VKELDEMKKRLKEMEEEAAALREMQAKVEKEMGAVQGLFYFSSFFNKKTNSVTDFYFFNFCVSEEYRSVSTYAVMHIYFLNKFSGVLDLVCCCS